MRRTIFIAAFAVGFGSCSARTQHYSDPAREFARRLCSIQYDCDCSENVVIPDCENRVEHEFVESERHALDAGLVYDAECMAAFLADIDELGTCGVEYPDFDPCAVYGGDQDVGEPCEVLDTIPLMYSCRVNLACIDGVCRDLENPILSLGAICSTEQGDVPTGWLGRCDEGLRCDSQDTRACVPVMPESWPPLGGECTIWYGCTDDNICRPQGDDPQPSEERPGVCVEQTPSGEPCTLVYECDRICEDGICQVPPPALCDILRNWWVIHQES